MCNDSIRTGSVTSAMSSLPDIVEYDADTLRRELTLLGFEPGPITKTTKGVYMKKFYQLKKRHPVSIANEKQGTKKPSGKGKTNKLLIQCSYKVSLSISHSPPFLHFMCGLYVELKTPCT